MAHRYQNSETLLARALRTIPLASQTFSKSITQYPRGVSPLFISRGAGSHVWDVDGNEYVDFVNGLAAVTLGYNDPDVTAAVKRQLDDGVVFSLPHPLEMTVAEKLVQMIPCADMVRFGKNGSDATSGAVRLARAHTRRDHVLVCGYHGWQDWYIGSTSRSLGVPQSVRDLTHTFPYNDLPALDALFRAHREQVAAVILEPMNVTEPAPGYLAGVREIAHRHGALLVFDETITGFRFDRGGAQRYFGVTPDLATFGKGIANGYPLSALVGRADVMRLMEEIFFSSTFGGETASLAASLATLEKLEREPILESMHATGRELQEGARKLIDRHELGAVLGISGHPSWSFLLIKDAADYSQWHIRTFVLQEMFARGILMIGSHNMSYAHSRDDLAKLFAAYDEVFGELRDALGRRDLEERLKCESLKPLFRVR
jgi:glutamate-1-semialdehyde 2,1-aminomutase